MLFVWSVSRLALMPVLGFAMASAQREHIVKTPLLQMAGVVVQMRVPSSYTLVTEAKSGIWIYRELSGRLVSRGPHGQTVELGFLAWSRTRATKLGHLKGAPIALLDGHKGYSSSTKDELWFCVPLKRRDIAVCVVAYSFDSPKTRSQYAETLPQLKVIGER